MDYEVIWWIVTTIATYAAVFAGIKWHDRNNTYVDWNKVGGTKR